MIDLKGWISAEAKQRNKNASGATMASVATAAFSGNDFTQGVLIAEENWKFWGNGRAPGGMPPVQNLQRWIDALGLSLNAWAVAIGIRKRGTRDFREKRENVIIAAHEPWERISLPAMEEKTGKLIEDQFVEVTTKTLK